MADEKLLKDAVRLLLQALRETPGGVAVLGRLALGKPDLLATALSHDEAHSKSEYKRRVAQGDPDVLPPETPEDEQVRSKRETAVGWRPPTDMDGDTVTPQRLIAWLDAKFARHGEEEDKWAADYIRATIGIAVPVGNCPGCLAGNLVPFDHRGLPMARCDTCGLEVNDVTVNAACGVHGPIPCEGARCICAAGLPEK